MSFREVKPVRALETTLSTGTRMKVEHCKTEDGQDAWFTQMVTTEGDFLEFGLMHESLQALVQAVAKMYAEEAGFEVRTV